MQVNGELYTAPDDKRHLDKLLRGIDISEHTYQKHMMKGMSNQEVNRITEEHKAIRAEYIRPVIR